MTPASHADEFFDSDHQDYVGSLKVRLHVYIPKLLAFTVNKSKDGIAHDTSLLRPAVPSTLLINNGIWSLTCNPHISVSWICCSSFSVKLFRIWSFCLLIWMWGSNDCSYWNGISVVQVYAVKIFNSKSKSAHEKLSIEWNKHEYTLTWTAKP